VNITEKEEKKTGKRKEEKRNPLLKKKSLPLWNEGFCLFQTAIFCKVLR